MSDSDIQDEIQELYGIDVSPSMISKITDKVLNSVPTGQNRPLDSIYQIVYIDTVHFKVRDDHKIVSKAA
jgi:putative transposase